MGRCHNCGQELIEIDNRGGFCSSANLASRRPSQVLSLLCSRPEMNGTTTPWSYTTCCLGDEP